MESFCGTKMSLSERSKQSDALPVPDLPSPPVLEPLHRGNKPSAEASTSLFSPAPKTYQRAQSSLIGQFSYSPKASGNPTTSRPASGVPRLASIPKKTKARMSVVEHEAAPIDDMEIPELIVRPHNRPKGRKPKGRSVTSNEPKEDPMEEEFVPFTHRNKRKNPRPYPVSRKKRKKKHTVPQGPPEVITLSDSDDEEPSGEASLANNDPTESSSRYKSNTSLRPCAICTDRKTFHRSDTTSQVVYLLSSKIEYAIDGSKHFINYTGTEWEYATFPTLSILCLRTKKNPPNSSPPLSQEPEQEEIPSISQKLEEPSEDNDQAENEAENEPEDLFIMIFDTDITQTLREIDDVRPAIEITFLTDQSDHYTELLKFSSLYEQAINRPKRITRGMAKGKKRTLLPENRVVLVWPPAPARDAVSITSSDLELLEPEEFLNDNIIDFYVRYIRLRLMSTEVTDQIYFFNCFLYKMITSIVLKSSSSVLGWTGNVDISSKDYLILPINESMHWLLAIICFPREAVPHNSATANQVENNYRPGILLFDSMSSYSRSGKITKHIRKYLSMVWAAQQGVEFKFTNKNLPLRKPKVPQQSNGSDCGVFLLHFIEKFCEEPHWNPQQFNLEWFCADEIEAKRKQIRNIVWRLKAESDAPEGEVADTEDATPLTTSNDDKDNCPLTSEENQDGV